MNPLVHSQAGDEDFLRTVEALLEESEEDRRILELELQKKKAEIEEKEELIRCLRGEKPKKKVVEEEKPLNSEDAAAELETKLREKIGELGEIESNIRYYSDKLSNIEEKATRIASLGDKAITVLRKQIEKLNSELRLREEIISEYRLKRDVYKIVNKELNKIRKPAADNSGEQV